MKKENSIDLYQESNSMSHLSTTSKGEQAINTNYNSYFFYESFTEEKKINKNKYNNKNGKLYESIKKGINEISDLYNNNKNNVISISCYYFCNINMDEKENQCFEDKIQKFINNYKNVIKKK